MCWLVSWEWKGLNLILFKFPNFQGEGVFVEQQFHFSVFSVCLRRKIWGTTSGFTRGCPSFCGFHPFSCLHALSTVLQINFCGSFDDVGCLPGVWVDTAKIMSLSNQVLLDRSDDQNGLLGQIHSSSLWRNFCSLLWFFSTLLLFSV